ncbi:MAG: S9 family peptidase [Chloroflexota bacterium]|nr:S9 family peptidase [Chloroflexota bacterium]
MSANPTAPEAEVTVSPATYARAERFLPWNVASLMRGLEIQPRWIAGGDAFWFRQTTPTGTRFVRCDPERGACETAFDHVRLAAALSRASGLPFAAGSLPFDEIELAANPDQVRFTLDDAGWTCDLGSYACRRGEAFSEPVTDVERSPDGKQEAFVRDCNLWLRDVAGGDERALTTDGEELYAYGSPLPSPLVAAGLAEPAKPLVIWAPDGSRFLSCRIDQRQAKCLDLVQSVPKDGSHRLRTHRYAYPLPGDDVVPGEEVWLFDLASAAGVRAAVDPIPVLYHGQPVSAEWVWWTAGNEAVFLLTRNRGFLAYRLWQIDSVSGEARVIIEERGEHGIDPYLSWGSVTVRVAGNGRDVIWSAQRDGWSHLYLYDAGTGQQVRQLTSGEFNVVRVVHLDESGRWLYFTAMGREPERDPYYQHLYRVGLDGGEPELLTPAEAEHAICFTPSGKYFIDTYSRSDQLPVTELRSAAGALVSELARADIDALAATGWRPPERFVAKSRDGVTDVYGIMLRPTGFDPDRRYPVIDYIYAGPQVNVVPTTFAQSVAFDSGDRPNRGYAFWHAQALAELGFIVVMIDGLGMPARGKAYHDVTYRNLGDGGIPDHIAALRQLGDRFPALDLDRVGIYGHSAGGYASAHAILTYPEFYSVCVSSAGNHDHRLDKAGWVERYMGLPVGDHYREQANQTSAGRLRGKLLLIHGEMDENVHPASTLALVEALIRENKDFDLLIMPNRPHRLDDSGYFIRRRWDYFVRHLLGKEPPEGYRVGDEVDPPCVLPHNHNRDPASRGQRDVDHGAGRRRPCAGTKPIMNETC